MVAEKGTPKAQKLGIEHVSNQHLAFYNVKNSMKLTSAPNGIVFKPSLAMGSELGGRSWFSLRLENPNSGAQRQTPSPIRTPRRRVVVVPGGVADQLRGHAVGPLPRHLVEGAVELVLGDGLARRPQLMECIHRCLFDFVFCFQQGGGILKLMEYIRGEVPLLFFFGGGGILKPMEDSHDFPFGLDPFYHLQGSLHFL